MGGQTPQRERRASEGPINIIHTDAIAVIIFTENTLSLTVLPITYPPSNDGLIYLT